MPTNKLSDAQIRALRPEEKPYKRFDGGGLYIFITPAGGRLWRLAYRRAGKAQTKSLGAYPKVGLKEARRLRDEFSPSGSDMTVQQAAERYWGQRQDVSAKYLLNVTNAFKRYVYPALGDREIGSISRRDVLDALNPINAAGKYSYVRKVRNWLSAVFDWAIEQEHCEINPCRSINPQRAFGKARTVSHPCVRLDQAHELMARIGLEDQRLVSVQACYLLALTWVRTAELRMARWQEIEGGLWRIPAARMKMSRDHLVPLSALSMGCLARAKAGQNGTQIGLILPNDRQSSRPLSENAILALLHRVGYKGRMTGHGFRALGSTWAYENGYRSEVVEMQLAHVQNATVAAYNRAEYLDERRAMLESYSQWLFPTGLSDHHQ